MPPKIATLNDSKAQRTPEEEEEEKKRNELFIGGLDGRG